MFITNITRPIITVNNTANPRYPIPAISPDAIARKIVPISFAVPGTDLNLTSENAPAAATPAPTFPFSIIITIHTTAGSIASVMTKLDVYLPL